METPRSFKHKRTACCCRVTTARRPSNNLQIYSYRCSELSLYQMELYHRQGGAHACASITVLIREALLRLLRPILCVYVLCFYVTIFKYDITMILHSSLVIAKHYGQLLVFRAGAALRWPFLLRLLCFLALILTGEECLPQGCHSIYSCTVVQY